MIKILIGVIIILILGAIGLYVDSIQETTVKLDLDNYRCTVYQVDEQGNYIQGSVRQVNPQVCLE